MIEFSWKEEGLAPRCFSITDWLDSSHLRISPDEIKYVRLNDVLLIYRQNQLAPYGYIMVNKIRTDGWLRVSRFNKDGRKSKVPRKFQLDALILVVGNASKEFMSSDKKSKSNPK